MLGGIKEFPAGIVLRNMDNPDAQVHWPMSSLLLKLRGGIGLIDVRLTPCGHFVITLQISRAENF